MGFVAYGLRETELYSAPRMRRDTAAQ
jgi:hypothetical protein